MCLSTHLSVIVSVNPFAVSGIIISILSLLAFLVVNYDRIIIRYLSWRYTPEIEVGISLWENEFFESDPISITQLQPYDDDLMFGIGLSNAGQFDCEIDLNVAGSHMMKTPAEYFDAPEEFQSGYTVETVHHGSGGSPPKRYKFSTMTLRARSFTRSINFVLELNPEEIQVFRSTRVEITAEIQAEASQFPVPLLNRVLPDEIGTVGFGTVQREYEILGPHHDDVDMSKLGRSDEDTKEMKIEQPHGYMLDSEGRVVARFSGFNLGIRKVSDSVTEIEYVDDPSNFDRETHPKYEPDPIEPPWEE